MSDRFPENFMWGSATSAHQVEGDNVNNNWWEWEQSGHIQPSGKACDQYHRFKEDFAIAKELCHNVHRFGIEWSRVEKDDGVWDRKEWDHYKEVVDELIKLGIEPMVTLNHFTIPVWFERKGGWLSGDSARLFTRFAARAVKELGGRVRWWMTINEPCVVALGSYVNSKWPPEKMTHYDALTTLKNMLKSHVEAYREMKETARSSAGAKEPKISIAKAVTAFHPCTRHSIRHRLAAFLRNNFYNHSFIRSAITGRSFFFPYINEKLPVKNTLDFIGLNYYTREHVHFIRPMVKKPIGEICSREHHVTGKRTDMGWEIYPEGIYEAAKTFSRYGLPIFITENGIASDDDTRKKFIKDHLVQVLRAINEGVDMIGYLYWSLLDNFEWAEGYRPRFGLVEVDFKTQKRTIRDSARYLAEVIRTGKI